MNRLGVENERVLQRSPSPDTLALSRTLIVATRWVRQRQGYIQARRLSHEMFIVSCADPLVHGEGHTRLLDMARTTADTAGSMDWSMDGNSKHENRETSRARRTTSSTAVWKPHRGYHGHERNRGVRWIHNTVESN